MQGHELLLIYRNFWDEQLKQYYEVVEHVKHEWWHYVQMLPFDESSMYPSIQLQILLSKFRFKVKLQLKA